MSKTLMEIIKKPLIELQKKIKMEPNRRPRILGYHSVKNRDWQLSVSPNRFEKHLQYLDGNFEVIELEDLVEGLINSRDMRGKIAITFDDGHKDNITNAFPILEKYNMKATFFITTDFVEERILNRFPMKNSKSMDWNDIIKLEEHGHEIGSHTISHKHLKTLPKSKLKREILDSKKIIEKRVNTKIKSFAYPAGRFDKRSKKIAKKGYQYCCSVIGGHEDISKEPLDLYDLRRTPINDMKTKNFVNVVNGYYDLVYLTSDLFFTGKKSRAERKNIPQSGLIS